MLKGKGNSAREFNFLLPRQSNKSEKVLSDKMLSNLTALHGFFVFDLDKIVQILVNSIANVNIGELTQFVCGTVLTEVVHFVGR